MNLPKTSFADSIRDELETTADGRVSTIIQFDSSEQLIPERATSLEIVPIGRSDEATVTGTRAEVLAFLADHYDDADILDPVAQDASGIEEIYATLQARRDVPEAVSVLVVVPSFVPAESRDALIRAAAPKIAAVLHEGMRFGEVLHVEEYGEPVESTTYEVAVRVR